MSERPPDDWTVTLIAYANGTLEADERVDVEAALAGSDDLRRELNEIETVRRAVRRDDAPPTIPDSVWARIDGIPGVEDELAPTLPPPIGPATLSAPPGNVVPLPTGRRRRMVAAVTAVAAAAVLVVTGAVVITRLDGDDDPGGQQAVPSPTGPPAGRPSPLEAQPQHALMRTEIAMASARTANLDVSGQALVTFDARLIGGSEQEEMVLDITGDGAVDFGDGSPNSLAYRLLFAMKAVSGPELARPEDTTWETIVVGGKRYSNENGGPYSESEASTDPDDQGLFAQIALSPDVLARLPELAEGEIDDLGVEQLFGVDVRHLRFDLKMDPAEGWDEQIADVWIDETGVVRKLSVTSRGSLDIPLIDDATMEITLDIELQDLGAPVEISAPS